VAGGGVALRTHKQQTAAAHNPIEGARSAGIQASRDVRNVWQTTIAQRVSSVSKGTPEGCLNRIEQGFLAEWFAQEGHRARLERLRARPAVPARCRRTRRSG